MLAECVDNHNVAKEALLSQGRLQSLTGGDDQALAGQLVVASGPSLPAVPRYQ